MNALNIVHVDLSLIEVDNPVVFKIHQHEPYFFNDDCNYNEVRGTSCYHHFVISPGYPQRTNSMFGLLDPGIAKKHRYRSIDYICAVFANMLHH